VLDLMVRMMMRRMVMSDNRPPGDMSLQHHMCSSAV